MPNTAPDLANILRDRISKEGPISVAAFMATALSHPQQGYYVTRDPLGRSGDFITAPEVSQMFGELIGLWAATVWQFQDCPQNIRLIELGPGRGTLMADALRAIDQAMPDLSRALCVDLVEISPILRERQKESLLSWHQKIDINWHDTIDTIPGAPCIIIANEFFDALPVHQYERLSEGWCERLVGLDEGGGFCFEHSGILADDSVIPEHFQYEPVGQFFESNPSSIDIVGKLCDRMAGQKSACLIIDYGHIKQGVGETMQAIKGQIFHDVLCDPGEADLTAHVDFEALSTEAKNKGCRVYGPVLQKEFLEGLGIQARAEKLMAGATPDQAKDVQRALDRLIGEQEMGTLFKVVSFSDLNVAALPGFE